MVLEAKETISLINGTQAMLAVGTLSLLAAETLVDSADVIGGLTSTRSRVPMPRLMSESIGRALTAGKSRRAANLRQMLEGSQIRESHRECGRVQDAYSLRCIPQVHGAVRERWHTAEMFSKSRPTPPSIIRSCSSRAIPKEM